MTEARAPAAAELSPQTPYYVRVYSDGGRFRQSTFAHYRDAKAFALGRRRAGWLRSEIDVGHFEEGSINAAL
jgi:hypothetical protein